jgi:hypothetical protein
MTAYRFDANDGTEHILTILGEKMGFLDIEAVHRQGGAEIRVEEQLNKCLFEEMLHLGVFKPA